jgi:homoserine dehydrogenase
MEHKIGLVGCGTVGQGLLQILHEKKDHLRDAFGFEARIVAIADAYEALNSARDYKPAYPHEQCVEIIRGEAGSHFDPDLVQAFLKIEDSFRQIACQYGQQRLRAAPHGGQRECEAEMTTREPEERGHVQPVA